MSSTNPTQAVIDAARAKCNAIADPVERRAAADALATEIERAVNVWSERMNLSETEALGIALDEARAQHSPDTPMTFAEEAVEREADELHRAMFGAGS